MDKDRIDRATQLEVSLFPRLEKRIRPNFLGDTGFSLKTVQEAPHLHVEGYISGRVTQINNLGKILFIFVKRDDYLWQICVTKDLETFPLAKKLQVGDIITSTGPSFRTNQDKLCLWAMTLELLAKSYIDPGKVLAGNTTKDIEKLRRMRYLEMIQTDAEDIKHRSWVIQKIRKFFEENQFIEVETPVLLPVNSGANAKPFITQYNALGEDFYLRVAPELALKRLLVGGMDKIFEIGKNFRNEGMSKRHNPEFTSLEAYAAYTSCVQLISFFRGLLSTLSCDLEEIEVVAMKTLVDRVSPGTPYEELNSVFETLVAPNLIAPTIVTEHPLYCSPLAKAKDSLYADRFEFYWKGMEIANGFAEENDPVEQRKKFLSQSGEEKMELDEDFLTALEYGMPPSAGLGIGIDRLLMCLMQLEDINDVITFPHYARKT